MRAGQSPSQDRVVNGEVHLIRLELTVDGQSLTGWARDEHRAISRRFDGRLGLLAAIDALIDRGPPNRRTPEETS